MVAAFDRLFAEVGTWEGVSASATKTCVVFINKRTFLVVKFMKEELDLKFVLPGESDEFPIYKRQAYGRKLEHYIRLRDEDDVDGDVFRLLRKAYTLGLAETETATPKTKGGHNLQVHGGFYEMVDAGKNVSSRHYVEKNCFNG